jgi:hypothetical protein
MAGSESAGYGANRFHTTRWSVVLLSARSEVSDGQEGFGELCKLYWYPLYGFIRHRGYSTEDAQDLTQGFFLHLIERERLKRADRSKGKFRSFLLASLQRCESIARDHLTTQKYDQHWSHWMLAFCARFLGRKKEAYQQMRESFVKGDVAFLGWLPDGPSVQIFKSDPEFQTILSKKDQLNAERRSRVLAIEKNY